jgi:hypothetical protein
MKTNIHFYHISSFLLRIRNVAGKYFRENQNTHFVFSNLFSKIVPFYDKMWKNIVELSRPQMTKYGSRALHVG